MAYMCVSVIEYYNVNAFLTDRSLHASLRVQFTNLHVKHYETRNRDHFYKDGLMLIQTWVSNNIHNIVCDEITYPFPNFNAATVEVWKWINIFFRWFTVHVIIHPCN